MNRLFILGTGGLAKEVAQLIARINVDGRWDEVGYIARTPADAALPLPFFPVAGDDAWLAGLAGAADLVVAVGHPALKRRIAERYRAFGRFAFPNLIHPTSEFDAAVNAIGIGNVIAKGVAISVAATIGDFNLVNCNATVGHDAAIGSYAVINPSSNVSGGVRIGDEVLLGAGSTVIENLAIAARTTVGAGSVVFRSILEPGGTHIGNPARLYRIEPSVAQAAG